MLTEKSYDTGSVILNYAEGAASGKPLLLLHDVTMRWQSFLPPLPRLSISYHTYALDLRGHGRSGHVQQCVYEIEEYGDDVIRFLRARVAQPVVLAGHSLGADIALWVAAAAPERVQAVVLEEPGLYLFSEDRFVQQPIYNHLSTLQEVLARARSLEEIQKTLQTLSPEADAARQHLWATSLQLMDSVALAHLLDGRTHARTRHDELLAQIKVPVLLLQGNPALGGILTQQDVWRAQALLHEYTHVYRADMGHNWHGMAPSVFFQLVNSFVESIPFLQS